MQANSDKQKDNKDVRRKKLISVFGIYLTESNNGQEILLINEPSKNRRFRFPGGLVLSEGGPERQKKREKHNLKKYTYKQSGIPVELKEPIGINTCALYTLGEELIKVYLLTFSRKAPSQHWTSLHPGYKPRLITIDRIFNGETDLEIEPMTKTILGDFLKRMRKKKKISKSAYLIPVREIRKQAIA